MHDVEKVQAYITRETALGIELLVFMQLAKPDEMLEVPGGTVDPGEDPGSAVLRETYEESGLLFSSARKLTECLLSCAGQTQLRHIFHILPEEELPDTWLHTVTGSGEDRDMVFRYFWLPLEQAAQPLEWMADWLGLLTCTAQ